MVFPIVASFVGGTHHVLQGPVEPFNDSVRFFVLGGGAMRAYPGVLHDLVVQFTDQVASSVGYDGARHSISCDDVFVEDIHDLRGGRVLVNGDGFHPSG